MSHLDPRFATRSALGWLLPALLAACAVTPHGVDPPSAPGEAAVRDRILDLDCGAARAELRFEGGEVTLVVDRQAVRVVPQPSASGVRWTANVLDDTFVLDKGDEYVISFRGQRLSPCTATERGPKPLVAIVHEPSWRLAIVAGSMTIERPGVEAVTVPVTGPRPEGGAGGTWKATLAGEGLELTIRPGRCRDAMTGVPRPSIAELRVGGATHRGCAGDPIELLAAGQWLVAAIDGEATPREPAITLEFFADGELVVFGGCERHAARFALGEGLAIEPDPAPATLTGCAESAAALDRRLFAALAAIERFDVDDDGRLRLEGGGRSRVTLVRR